MRFVAVLLLAGCAQHTEPIAAPVVEEAGPDEIVTVQFRDHTVRAYSGGRYTVLDAAGNVLADRVTQEELLATVPDIAAEWKRYQAGWAGHDEVDASAPPLQLR